MNEKYGTLVEFYWQEKTEVLRKTLSQCHSDDSNFQLHTFVFHIVMVYKPVIKFYFCQ